MYIADQTRIGEIIAVILTGLGKFIFMDWLQLRFLYIAIACIGWAVYILYRKNKNPHILTYWGFTRNDFRETFSSLLPYVILCTILFVIYGMWNDSIIFSWHFLPIVLIYPIWGIIQQFLVVALIGGNLNELTVTQLNSWFIVLLTASIFAVVHFPFLVLVIGTFLLALVYTKTYLKTKNLWVLGMYHGWLGAVFFYTVLERDPWIEVFARLG